MELSVLGQKERKKERKREQRKRKEKRRKKIIVPDSIHKVHFPASSTSTTENPVLSA
jgi:hypothetical protein